MSKTNRPYKLTKQLIKVAKEEGGLTHKAIAKKARLSEKSLSLVSKWANGKALATEIQMKSLVDEFGHFLKKQFEHVFYTYRVALTPEKVSFLQSHDSKIKLPINGASKALEELTEDEIESLIGIYLEEDSLKNYKYADILKSIDSFPPQFEYFKVKGERVFQHTLRHIAEDGKKTYKNAQYRIQVIRYSEDIWFIVTQKRATHIGMKKDSFSHPKTAALPVHSSAEASIWWSQCHRLTSTADIIEFIESYPDRFCFYDDCRLEARATLPYLIRSKLSELGYMQKEIIDMSVESTDH